VFLVALRGALYDVLLIAWPLRFCAVFSFWC